MATIDFAFEDVARGSRDSPYRGARLTIKTSGFDGTRFNNPPFDYSILNNRNSRLLSAWRKGPWLLIIFAASSSLDERKGALSLRYISLPAEIEASKALWHLVRTERMLAFEYSEAHGDGIRPAIEVPDEKILAPMFGNIRRLGMTTDLGEKIVTKFFEYAVHLKENGAINILCMPGVLQDLPSDWIEITPAEFCDLVLNRNGSPEQAVRDLDKIPNQEPQAPEPNRKLLQTSIALQKGTVFWGNALTLRSIEFEDYRRILMQRKASRFSRDREQLTTHRDILPMNELLSSRLAEASTNNPTASLLAVWFDVWIRFLRLRLVRADRLEIEGLMTDFSKSNPEAVITSLPSFLDFVSIAADEKFAVAIGSFVHELIPIVIREYQRVRYETPLSDF